MLFDAAGLFSSHGPHLCFAQSYHGMARWFAVYTVLQDSPVVLNILVLFSGCACYRHCDPTPTSFDPLWSPSGLWVILIDAFMICKSAQVALLSSLEPLALKSHCVLAFFAPPFLCH
jgi:hypothetical protein